MGVSGGCGLCKDVCVHAIVHVPESVYVHKLAYVYLCMPWYTCTNWQICVCHATVSVHKLGYVCMCTAQYMCTNWHTCICAHHGIRAQFAMHVYVHATVHMYKLVYVYTHMSRYTCTNQDVCTCSHHAIHAHHPSAAHGCSIYPRGTKPGSLCHAMPCRAVPWAAPVPEALCARAAALGFFVRGAGQGPPSPPAPRPPRPPRSKSAAFAYSEQVGAHMPKMHQTKLATIIIIKCAVVLGEGESLADKADNYEAQHVRSGFCNNYAELSKPAMMLVTTTLRHPPAVCSQEGCAGLGPHRATVGSCLHWSSCLQAGLWFGGSSCLGIPWRTAPVPQPPPHNLLLQQNPCFPLGLNPPCRRHLQKSSSPSPSALALHREQHKPFAQRSSAAPASQKLVDFCLPGLSHPPLLTPPFAGARYPPRVPLRRLGTRVVAGGDTPDSSPAASARGTRVTQHFPDRALGKGKEKQPRVRRDDGRCSARTSCGKRAAQTRLGVEHRAGCSVAPSNPCPPTQEENK